MTAVQNAPAEERVEGRGTLPPALLAQALTAVLPHSALEKDLLPAITGVRVDTPEPGKITLAATDRFTVGSWTMDWDGGDVDAFLPLQSAKELLAYAKSCPKTMGAYPGLSLDFGPDLLEVFDFTRRSQLPLGSPEHFPSWRSLVPDHSNGLSDGIQYAGINPTHFAKFGKAVERGIPLTLTFGGSPFKPIRVDTGEHFVGLLMPVRVPAPGTVDG